MLKSSYGHQIDGRLARALPGVFYVVDHGSRGGPSAAELRPLVGCLIGQMIVVDRARDSHT